MTFDSCSTCAGLRFLQLMGIYKYIRILPSGLSDYIEPVDRLWKEENELTIYFFSIVMAKSIVSMLRVKKAESQHNLSFF